VTITVDDPYRTLQVEPSADLEAIRAAYRRLARANHPDLNPRPEAAERMRAINAAYAVLSDPARRAVYDARRYVPPTQVLRPSAPPRVRPVVVVANPPTPLQRRVDRIVAVLGVLLLIGIGFYTVNVIPYAEQQFQNERRGIPVQPSAPAAGVASSSDHQVSASIPERLRRDSVLRGFPGTVLVAPSNLQPFASLPILRTEAASQGIARYAVYYGDLTTGSATISGFVGRASFDAGGARLPDCNPDGTYCAGPVPGQASGPPGLELFRTPGLVEDYPAYATHRVCCNGVFWSLSWYESRTNMSYSIDVSRSAAITFGGSVVEANLDAARAFAALAPQLVRLP
jgi:hypothetical protein